MTTPTQPDVTQRVQLLQITDSELDSGIIDHIPSFTSTPGPFWSPDERLERAIGKWGQGAYVYRALEDGANPNLKDAQGIPMLHRAVAFQFDVHDLFEHGAYLNATDPEGKTALHYAVAGNHVPTVQRLLEDGADPYPEDHDGLMPHELASNEASEAIHAYAQQHFNPLLKHLEQVENPKTKRVESKLDGLAEGVVSRELWKAFDEGWDINVRDDQGRTLLMAYAEALQEEAFEDVIRMGADVNARDKFGRTALMTISSYSGRFADILLKNGADPTLVDTQKMTALHRHGHALFGAVHELLLKHGADINAKDSDGETPLHYQVARRSVDQEDEREVLQRSDDSIRAMLERGADPTIQNNDGVSAGEMYLAQEKGDPETWMLVDSKMTKDKLQQSLPEAPAVKRSKSIRL